MNDMKKCYDDIDKVFPFDGETICLRAPDLMVYAPYDKFIPSKTIQPRDHQKQIIDLLHINMKNNKPILIIYNSMIGSGKTTTVSAALEIAKYHKKKLLCVCNLKLVREQMGNSFYNPSQIGSQNFAIGSIRKDGSIKLSQTWSKRGSEIDAIICGPEVAIHILNGKHDPKIRKLPKSSNFIVHSDEL
jgi:superfamily II DNA or RNA helicase